MSAIEQVVRLLAELAVIALAGTWLHQQSQL